jgi:hypothetical protein
MSTPQETKSWPPLILHHPHIKSRDDQDGFYIICLPCSILLGIDVCGHTKNWFMKHRWKQHATTCQKHVNNVKEFIHRQKQNKKPPKQTSMGSFFGACKCDNLMTTEAPITDNADAGSIH